MASEQQVRSYAFAASLDAWADRLNARIAEAYLHIILLLFENIVVGGNYSPGTPVDTGYARNSWVVGINSIGAFTQPPTDPTPPKRSSDGTSGAGQIYPTTSVEAGGIALLGVKLSDTVHLTSNCAYMGALEDGHSDKAPAGMVFLAIMAGQKIVDEVVQQMLTVA